MLRLLVIADVHYVSDPLAAAATPPARQALLGCDLLRRAVAGAREAGGFDAVALMGDLIDDPRQPDAAGDLRRLRAALDADAPACPLLVVAGNHDGNADMLLDAFDTRPGLREVGSCRVCIFWDAYEEAKYGTRREEDLRLLRDLADRPGPPVVALQHNPIYPPIDSDYPFMLTNGQQVVEDYAAAGVLLSVSGHYHAGQPLAHRDGVHYYTAAALSEAPHPYALITLDGRDVTVDEHQLER